MSRNEAATDAQMPQKPTWAQKYLASINVSRLPLPRRLAPNDPAFQDAQLKRGIKQRQRDERLLRALQNDITRAQQSRDAEKMRLLFERVTEIAFGKGVTAQMREDFLARYGCTGWTDEVLNHVCQIAATRGIVEIGAGHGQWARALTAFYEENYPIKKGFDFVLAFDDMRDLPLSTSIYHEHTQTAHDYFFAKVKKCTDFKAVLRQWSSRGRVLLLVYPPPGEMALNCIKAYTEMGPENDTVIYVGEGRGGSTANDALFDYLESGTWFLLDVLDVNTQPGGKGYEKMYVLKRQPVDLRPE